MTGYFAFIPAELLGVSAVLAAVSAGVYLGWHTPELTTSQVRLQGLAVWEIVQYMLNALLFVLVGLQLPVVLEALGDIPGAASSATRAREPHRDRHALRLGLRRPPCAEAHHGQDVQLAERRLPLLGGDARCRLACRCAGAAPPDRCRERPFRAAT